MFKRILFVLPLSLLFVFSTQSFAQHLPDEMNISPDGRMLTLGGNVTEGFYDESVIRKIELQFDQANWWTLLTNNYNSGTDLLATMWIDGVLYDSVGVRFKGQTSYFQNNTDKKSFNITLDYVKGKQDVDGYETLNLNCGWQDESGFREVLFNNSGRNYNASLKSNFAHLYINGQDWGPYQNVQQLNNEHMIEWYQDNDGTIWRALKTTSGPGGPGGGGPFNTGNSTLNYEGPDTSDYQPHYTLKRFKKQNKWEDLVEVCDKLNNTSLAALEDTLDRYLDIDKTCWYLAHEIIFSDDDGYIYKGGMDYYVYWEAATDRIIPMEYDGNSVMASNHANWDLFYNETDNRFPLMNRMLQVSSIRQRYLAHVRTILDEVFNSTYQNTQIDYYAALIDSLVQSDPKAIYSYNAFLGEVNTVKTFVTNRRNFLLADSEMTGITPLSISNVSYETSGGSWDAPEDGESVDVLATVSGNPGINSVWLYYGTGFVGRFTKVEMFDDGAHNDGSAGDGVYGATIPGMTFGTYVRFYVEAISSNSANTASYDPPGAEHDVYLYRVTVPQATEKPIVINEIMSDNEITAMDENGQYEDWIELYNNSNQTIDLSGWYITDDVSNLDKWAFPQGTSMAPDSYLIVWADEDGSQGDYHANFKLAKSGETVTLLNENFEIIDEVTWSDMTEDMGYARVPNGYGSFAEQAPTFAANNDWPVAIDDPEQFDVEFNLYPNPTHSTFFVTSSPSIETLELSVFNSFGQVVLNEQVLNGASIDVSQWAAGIYMIQYGDELKKLVVN